MQCRPMYAGAVRLLKKSKRIYSSYSNYNNYSNYTNYNSYTNHNTPMRQIVSSI